MMANGSILSAGGDNYYVLPANGVAELDDGRVGTRIYNPCNGECTGSWTRMQDMSSQRWYPTVVTLSTGDNIIVGGMTKNLDMGLLMGQVENNPTFQYYPPRSAADAIGPPQYLDLLQWAYPYNLYPIVFQLPSGNVFVFASNKSCVINTSTNAILTNIPDLIAPNHAPWMYPNSPTATVLPLTLANNYRFVIQLCGGSLLTGMAASDCYQIAPEDPLPTWIKVASMPNSRFFLS